MNLQDIKSKWWKTEEVVIRVRTASDGTNLSCDMSTKGCFTIRHRRFSSKIRNADKEIEGSGITRAENIVGAANRADSQH